MLLKYSLLSRHDGVLQRWAHHARRVGWNVVPSLVPSASTTVTMTTPPASVLPSTAPGARETTPAHPEVSLDCVCVSLEVQDHENLFLITGVTY